jgi:signal transduction histidine kinase
MKFKIKIISVILSFLYLFNPVQSQTQIDSLKSLLGKSEGKQKIKLLVQIGYYLSSENPNEAIQYLDEAIKLADKTNNRWSKADAVFNKGVALWHLGEITESDSYYEDAIKIYKEFNDSLSLIKVFNSQAINHQMKGKVDLAFETFLRSLDYAKKMGDNATVFNTLLNIGIMYDNNSNYDKCLYYYYEALKYSDEVDISSVALLQSYIAEVYLTLKNNQKAEEYLKYAVENSKLSNDTNSLIWAYSSLGKIELEKNNFTAAEKYFLESLSLAKKTEFKLEIIHSLTDLGKFYHATNNFLQAEQSLNETLKLAEEINSLSDKNVIYGELASLYYNKQDFKKAFEYHQKYKIYGDSLYSISNNEKLLELQTKQDLRQKEREAELLISENELQKKIISSQKLIALVISLLAIVSIIFIWVLSRSRTKILKARNELLAKHEEIESNRIEISKKNEVLAELNATKDKFFSIIAHDLRNPIAAFVNISDLLEQDYDKLSETDKKEIIRQMGTSSKNLIRLLENLLTWARLSNNKIEVYKENLLLKDVIEASIYPYLQAAHNKKIKINVDVPDSLTVETDKFIVQTIIGNLINNAVKFSNPHSDISVSLKNNIDTIQLSVRDRGIGIEESELRNIFVLGKASTGRGTQGEGGTGLGLVLVKELVEKLGWTIEVKSKVNAGSEFIVTITS